MIPRVSPGPELATPRLLRRAFRRSDLAAVPAGWSVGPPDFVGVGSGKSGSTWWWSLLQQHPEVAPNRLHAKELHYFCHFDYRGPTESELEVYREAFARPAGHACGEWSGNYLYYPLAPEYLARAAPDTKLLALVRDPVDRCLSSYNQFHHGRAKLFDLDRTGKRVLMRFSLFPEAMHTARLADDFRYLLRCFDRSQLLVLQYERCKRDPEGELARTLRFLGLDDAWRPEAIRRGVNVKKYLVAAPDAEQRAVLQRYFEADKAALLGMFPELDADLWS